MGQSNYVSVHVDKIKVRTEKAFLCMIGDEEVWLPQSQVSDPDDYDVGDVDLTLSVTEFIAKEKGLEEEE